MEWSRARALACRSAVEPASRRPIAPLSLLLPVALLLLGAAAGWTVHRALHPAVAAENEPPEGAHKTEVVTGTAARGDLALAETFFGVVAAAPASVRTLSSRAGGLVLAVNVAPGQQVDAGQVLLRFDPAPLQAAALAARSAFASAQNQRREFEAGGREKATAELAAAAAKAKVELQQAEADVARLQPLRADGL